MFPMAFVQFVLLILLAFLLINKLIITQPTYIFAMIVEMRKHTQHIQLRRIRTFFYLPSLQVGANFNPQFLPQRN